MIEECGMMIAELSLPLQRFFRRQMKYTGIPVNTNR